MPIDLPKTLIDAGGWVTAACVAIGMIVALVRGDLVPGAVYKREITRADTATEQLERWNDIGETMTAQVKAIADLVASVLQPRVK